MSAYVVFTREKTRDPAKLEEYLNLAPSTFEQRPCTTRAGHGRVEVLEGPATEDVVIVEFSTYEKAKAWYHSPEYQAAAQVRHDSADYRVILTEGIEEK